MSVDLIDCPVCDGPGYLPCDVSWPILQIHKVDITDLTRIYSTPPLPS
jgi:hypothetical protein